MTDERTTTFRCMGCTMSLTTGDAAALLRETAVAA
jgi:hypothetical protein